jgi:hypothetical protein
MSTSHAPVPQGLAVRRPRTRLALLLIGSLAFVAMGIGLAVSGGPPIVAWSTVVVFGAAAAFFVQQLLEWRPRLVIDERGIHDRAIGHIPWEDVLGATVRHARSSPTATGDPVLCLELKDPARYVARLTPLGRRMAALHRDLGVSDVTVDLSGTGWDPVRLEELLARELARARPTT